MEDYRTFAELEDTISPNQPGVHSFEAIEIKGSNKKEGAPPYQIMEVIEVESFAHWENVLNSKIVKEKLAGPFKAVVDESSVVMMYGNRIVKQSQRK